MINLEKITWEKCQAPPLLRRPAPASYFHPLFLFFRSPHHLGEVIKIYSPFKMGGEGSELWLPILWYYPFYLFWACFFFVVCLIVWQCEWIVLCVVLRHVQRWLRYCSHVIRLMLQFLHYLLWPHSYSLLPLQRVLWNYPAKKPVKIAMPIPGACCTDLVVLIVIYSLVESLCHLLHAGLQPLWNEGKQKAFQVFPKQYIWIVKVP